jgi:hypothetical protein
MADILARSVPLVFTRHGSKFYASTPGGEIAYGDSQGLYEWRNGQVIVYSGGDRQASDPGGFWTTSATAKHVRSRVLGCAAALSRARLN